jgi:hypothetical protein
MKALFIIVPILLIGGALGAASMGIINVPGVTPKKAEAKKTAEEAEQPQDDESTQTDTVEDQQVTSGAQTQEPASEPARSEPPKANTNPEQGAKALAKYWDEIDIAKLIPITETYKEQELAQVLFFMQKTKVAELLSAVSADRAARLSRELQRLASVVKEEAP